MRRGTVALVGLFLASVALPPAAGARPLLLKMMQGLTAPLGAVLGGASRQRRAALHHRIYGSRARSAGVAAASAAAAATAATTAAASTGSAPTADGTVSGPDAATPQAATTPTGAATATPADQKTAALPAPANESQARATAEEAPEPARTPVRAAPKFGAAGPAAWPTAYEDVIGFALWPKDYVERLRGHGIGEVLATALSSGEALAAKTRQARADEPGQPPAATTSACGGADAAASDWPTAELKSSINLNATQSANLDQIKTALGDALRSVKASCRDTAKLSPVERLRAMQDTLWAVHDAAQLVREPLARFYDSLSEEQKKKFAAPAMPESGTPPSRAAMARMCDLSGSTDAVRRIEQSIRPTKPQKASLDALQKKSFEMGQFLIASCLKPPPATPVERLDAAADRLTAVIFAASSLNVALNDFTSQLTDEQKAKLSSVAW